MESNELRQQKLLEHLQASEGYVAAKKLAEILQVSNKVVYRDIDELNQRLDGELVIEKVPRKGIKIKEKNVEGILPEVEKVDFLQSFQYRQIQIMKRLLVEQKSITYGELSTLFFVEQSIIQDDLVALENVLLGQNIHFISGNFGTRIIGNEQDIQEAIFEVIEEVLAQKHIVYQSEKPVVEVLTVVYDESIVEYAQEKVRELIQANRQIVGVEQQQALTILLTVFIDRIQRSKHITPNEMFFKKLNGMELYMKAYEFLQKIQSEKNFVCIPYDVEYISSMMTKHGIDYGMYDITVDETTSLTIETFTNYIAETSRIQITQDDHFIDSLNWFVPAMIERVKKQHNITNPLFEFIKEEYQSSYGMTQEASHIFEETFELTLPEQEVAFLTIFVQAAFDRIVQPRNILLVCPVGLATSEVLFERVNSVIRQSDHLELANLQQLYHKDIENVDYIISSVVLEKSIEKPIIYVSALVTDEEIDTIAAALATQRQDSSTEEHDQATQKQDDSGKNEQESDAADELEQEENVADTREETTLQKEKIVSQEEENTDNSAETQE